MAHLKELLAYANSLLDAAGYQDYCPNGLQVEGRPEVGRIISGVTASAALIEVAVEAEADAVLVHHGYFWKGEEPSIVGMKKRRLERLLCHGISLIAYHLPLDGHPELGNNAQLARLFGIAVEGRFGEGAAGGLAMYGCLESPLSADGLGARIAQALGREPLHIPGTEHPIRRVGWCSGAAQGYLERAAELGLDAFISGEISEPTVHIARELGVHYFAAGHHATERYGVQALGDHLADHFALEHRFVEIPNPA